MKPPHAILLVAWALTVAAIPVVQHVLLSSVHGQGVSPQHEVPSAVLRAWLVALPPAVVGAAALLFAILACVGIADTALRIRVTAWGMVFTAAALVASVSLSILWSYVPAAPP